MSRDAVAGPPETGLAMDRTESIGSRKGSMGPPNYPSSSSSAPRMSRLPSLQQISDRLHHPTPLSIQSPSTSNIETSHLLPQHDSPIKRKLSISTGDLPPALSPYTASPSGRLKLPPSAMMRSQSASGVIPMRQEGVSFSNLEPFNTQSGTALAERSESMSRGPSREGYIKGYRDVPSLSAIRARMGSIKSQVTEAPKDISPITSSTKPESTDKSQPVPASASDPSSSSGVDTLGTSSGASHGKRKEHALRHSWTLFFDSKGLKPDPSFVEAREGETLGDWEKTLVTVGRFETVEGFARHLNNIKLPGSLARNSNYHLFKNGIRPMWEDPANAKGGKWVILFRAAPHLMDIAWANLTMSLVGDVLDPEDKVCGVVASSRPKVDRIQVWTRQKDDVEGINLIGRRILESMALEGRESESMSMEFQYNSGDSHPPAGTFLYIPFSQRSASFALPPTPSRLTVPEAGHGSDRRVSSRPSSRSPTSQDSGNNVGSKSLPVERSVTSSNALPAATDGLEGPGSSTPHVQFAEAK